MATPFPVDVTLLRRAFALADEARAQGDHPFGALLAVDGRVVAGAPNRVNTAHDVMAHAETELVRVLQRSGELAALLDGVVYTSCEPCPMCVGALFWAGARRVVFGLSTARLNRIATPPGAEMVGFTCTASDLADMARPAYVFSGPWLEDEAALGHEGFWR